VSDARRIVQLVVPEGDAELAADALWQGHPSAVSEESIGDGQVRLTADVADAAGLDHTWPIEVLAVDGSAYLDAWRDWAKPLRAGRRIVVHPAWLPLVGDSGDDLVILLDAGRSFGSGSHPSTRLVLAMLEERLVGGELILDVGCGSGVLAIAACRLGAAGAVALDLDPAALEAARANAVTNGVDDRLDISARDLTTVEQSFDVVVANIGVRALVEMAPALVPRLRAGALLVLAGLLVDQVDEVVARCAGCDELERRTEDGWSASVLRRVV
jgi:ribosomal protein L11 methyltransferase